MSDYPGAGYRLLFDAVLRVAIAQAVGVSEGNGS